jgi:protein disulfide-isomerase
MKALAAAGLVLGASITANPGALAATSSHGAPWFAGTTEEAYAKAKAEKKPMLLYWGAVWCPPCNELKNEVFLKPRFAELMAPMLAVYLDGDGEDAQAWADKLKVTGYPTVLVLDPDGKEVWRLGTTVSIDEFEAALSAALNAGKSVNEAIARATSGQASDDDWRMLASYSWVDTDGLTLSDKALLEAKHKLALRVPERLTKERAQLAAAFVEAAAMAAQDPKTKADAEAYVKEAPGLIDLFLKNDQTVKATRSTIIYSSAEIVGWAYPKGKARDKAIKRWLAAAEVIAKDQMLSIDTRLWALNPRLALLRLEKPDAPVPADLKKTVTEAATRADQEAKTPYERKAVVAGAAYLMRDVGNFDGARALLDKELKTTDTPWYYQSSYASLEKAAGNRDAALEWAAKARQSVKGRASRLQWIVEDLALTTKLGAPEADLPRLEEIVKDYYETALSLPDGFKGRNATRAKRVADQLKPWLGRGKLGTLVKNYAAKCQANAALKPTCTEHFASLNPDV